MNITAVLSGPVAGRSPLLTVLQRLGANINEQPESNPSHGLPDVESIGWVTVVSDDLSVIEQALARTPDWGLRLHWNTPDCRACDGQGKGAGGSVCLHCLGHKKTNRHWTPPDPLVEMGKRVEQLERKLAGVSA